MREWRALVVGAPVMVSMGDSKDLLASDTHALYQPSVPLINLSVVCTALSSAEPL